MREKSGRFQRVEDLLAVRGISQKKLDAMRPYVTVSAPPPPRPRRKAVLLPRNRQAEARSQLRESPPPPVRPRCVSKVIQLHG